MIRAYDGIYLEDAMQNFAVMMDYGSRVCRGGMDGFYDRLLASDVVRQFETGNPRYLVGMSGIDLATQVIVSTGGGVRDNHLHPRAPFGHFLDRLVLCLSPVVHGDKFRESSPSGTFCG